MMTITIRLPDVEAAMLLEVFKRDGKSSSLDEFFRLQILRLHGDLRLRADKRH